MRLTLVLVMGAGMGMGCDARIEVERRPAAAPAIIEGPAIGVLAVFHDEWRGVTCYRYGEAVSCLPDSQLKDGGR